VTYGHCVANLYCAETVLGTCALSDLGDAGGLRRSGQAMIPETGLIRDEPRFVDVMLSRRADDKKRSSISRFVSHLMFVFVLYHEIFHCTLGHCIELNKLNIRPRLREFGIAPEATTPEPWPLDDKLYHGFELSADSHAADGVMIAVLNKLDLPTRSGFFDESEFNRERLSLFAMSLVIAMWHEMDRNGEFDLLHPEPITRFLTVFDCVLNAATNRGGEELAVRLAKTLLNDLESAGSAIPEIDRAFNGLKNVNSYELVRESAALRKKVADNRFRIRRPL